MPTNPRVLSRRTAVGGVAAAAAAMLAGCTSDNSRSSATHTPAPSHSPGIDHDVKIAASVLEHERALLELVAATARRHPRLAGTLASTRAAHRAHVALLIKAVPDNTPYRSPSPGSGPSRVLRRPASALSALAAAERRLSDAGARSSLAAHSGPLARVLASMAAAASQQSVHLAAAAGQA